MLGYVLADINLREHSRGSQPLAVAHYRGPLPCHGRDGQVHVNEGPLALAEGIYACEQSAICSPLKRPPLARVELCTRAQVPAAHVSGALCASTLHSHSKWSYVCARMPAIHMPPYWAAKLERLGIAGAEAMTMSKI